MSEAQRLRKEAAQDRKRIAELEAEAERLRSEFEKMTELHDEQFKAKNAAEAEVERLKWMLHRLFMDYDHIGLYTEDFDEWLADLAARYEKEHHVSE